VELDYLGIHLQVREDVIVLSQLSMVRELVKDVHGTANSPAADDDLITPVGPELAVALNKDDSASSRR